MTYFLVAAALTGLAAFVLTGWLFSGARSPGARWIWFILVWIVGLILAYVPAP